MRLNTIPGILFQVEDRSRKARDVVRMEYRLYQMTLVILDFVLTYLAFSIAYTIRFHAGLPFFSESFIPQVATYNNAIWYSLPFWILIFAMLGLYQRQNLLGGTQEYKLVINASTLGMFLIVSLGFFLPDDLVFARGWVLMAWGFTIIFLMVGRFAYRRVIYRMRARGHFQVPAVIVGANEEGVLLAGQFLENTTSGIRIIGYFDDQPNHSLDGKIPWLGSMAQLESISGRGVNEIILTSSALSQEQVLSLFRRFGMMKDVNLRMSSGLYEIITTGMQVKEDGMVPLLTINKVRMTGADQALKAFLDYAIAITACLLLSPLFIIIAIAIRLDSPGPIIYRRKVIGVNGKQFDAFKFRTMRADSDDILQTDPALMKEYLENFKIKDDPRVTRVGQFLRKTSMDELPQLLNVLCNQMSIIGPRMITPQELGKYSQWDMNLLTVKPGLTGLWQVRGRSSVSYDERVRLDMYYIRNWTFWLDIQLLIQTIPAVLSRRGAF